MNVFAHVEDRIAAALEDLKQDGVLPADLVLPAVEVETPRESAHGDLSTNAALVLAKAARMKPREIAESLKEKLSGDGEIAQVQVAGPGFLNLTFTPEFWQGLVRMILKAGSDYGRGMIGNGETINVEYVSANPTGPMHVGHCRGAVFGDALCNILEFAGYKVTREYYVNDAGGQVDQLARSVYLRYREALGEDIGEIPVGLYPGDYLKPIGEMLAKEHKRDLLNQPEEDWLPIVRAAAVKPLLAEIKRDLAALNIKHDVFFSEASLTSGKKDQVKAAIEALRAKGLIYEGRLPRPKGHDDDEWEDRQQLLFRSTDFGDDVDRALTKSDGSYTYFASDVAYHYDKLERGFDHYRNVFGADHLGYIPRIKASVAALSDGKADFQILVCQLVKVLRAGEPVLMSKRAGTFVTLRDMVDEVGSDPVRFMMLMRKNDAPLDFDLARVLEQTRDNPVFYVQYAHARAASVFRNAKEVFPGLDKMSKAVRQADLSCLSDPGEIEWIKRLAFFPRLVASSARAEEPHRLAFYLYDLASAFHSQWTRGNDSPHLRFIQAKDELVTAARLALIVATQQVISSGLFMLGVEAPESMR
jgi:arginyl-tRNA synthetase